MVLMPFCIIPILPSTQVSILASTPFHWSIYKSAFLTPYWCATVAYPDTTSSSQRLLLNATPVRSPKVILKVRKALKFSEGPDAYVGGLRFPCWMLSNVHTGSQSQPSEPQPHFWLELLLTTVLKYSLYSWTTACTDCQDQGCVLGVERGD